MKQNMGVFGIKPDGIINFLSNEPPFRYKPTIKIPQGASTKLINPAPVHYWLICENFWLILINILIFCEIGKGFS